MTDSCQKSLPEAWSASTQEVSLLSADLYEAAGAVRQVGEIVASKVGQTQARWQVLSVLSGSGWTVPQAARRLGVARQSVQRVVDLLVADGLVELLPNPDHARSRIAQLTALGVDRLDRIREAAGPWHGAVASQLSLADLRRARSVLKELTRLARGYSGAVPVTGSAGDIARPVRPNG
jgi:DNA-binding MarR family transcriptional regulator